MAWRLADSLIVLRSEVNAAYPKRSKVSDGSVGDLAHASRASDHNPDPSGIVRAIDVTEWDPGTPAIEGDDVAEALAEFLRRSKDPRVKYVIWRGRMFSSYVSNGRPAWQWRTYTGSNGHFKHVHVSVQPGALGNDSRPWGFTRPGTPTQADPNKGRPWKQFAAGATDALLYNVKGARNDQVAELEILMGNRVDHTFDRADVQDVVALKKAADWRDDEDRSKKDRSSVITARFMDALRNLAKG